MSVIHPTLPVVTPRGRSRPANARKMGANESVSTALEAIRTNKTRSMLTALGIIIGVAAVIVMISLGQGASANVAQRLQGLGTNTLTIRPGSRPGPGFNPGLGSQRTLTEADAAAIAQQVGGIRAVSPVLQVNVQAVSAGSNWSTSAAGVYPAYQGIQNWKAQAGNLFSDQDQDEANTVAVIGQTVLDNLFGNGSSGSGDAKSAVGQTIRLSNVPFTVIGVLASKSEQEDNIVLVPYSAAHLRLSNQRYVNQIVVQASDASALASVQKQITVVLEEQHGITNGKDDFNVFNATSMVQTAESVTQTLTMLLSGVAAVSLLVGGIGIMNIMLVSVTERTREIGIRTAIGARKRDILTQFLVEAVVLSGTGGVVGMIVGAAGSFGIARFAGWNTVIVPQAILLAFSFAAAVGIFFGYYPARKASRLNPIEALRYE